ncbi:MAG: hypothetical protein CM1200mP41_36900 [Gammaproteobacteria bacterium]|nr:MAG: hypothetical protein CM1200mP41_36900 [Gammaproteobacteria bacterium]
MFHAVYPAATYMGWTSMVAFELIAKALSQVVDSIPASSGGDEPGLCRWGFSTKHKNNSLSATTKALGGAEPTAMTEPMRCNILYQLIRNTSIEVLEQLQCLSRKTGANH